MWHQSRLELLLAFAAQDARVQQICELKREILCLVASLSGCSDNSSWQRSRAEPSETGRHWPETVSRHKNGRAIDDKCDAERCAGCDSVAAQRVEDALERLLAGHGRSCSDAHCTADQDTPADAHTRTIKQLPAVLGNKNTMDAKAATAKRRKLSTGARRSKVRGYGKGRSRDEQQVWGATIAQLTSMGYSECMAEVALEEGAGDLDRAVNFLLTSCT